MRARRNRSKGISYRSDRIAISKFAILGKIGQKLLNLCARSQDGLGISQVLLPSSIDIHDLQAVRIKKNKAIT